jgi:hypothetical protein
MLRTRPNNMTAISPRRGRPRLRSRMEKERTYLVGPSGDVTLRGWRPRCGQPTNDGRFGTAMPSPMQEIRDLGNRNAMWSSCTVPTTMVVVTQDV